MEPNPPPIFTGAKSKIKRADHHIEDLKSHLGIFIARKPYRLVPGFDPDGGQPIIQIKYKEAIPDGFAVVIGDAVHNLRTALDHMIWELVGFGRKPHPNLKFPTAKNRTSFEGACKGLKARDPSVTDILKALEVFPGGKGESLYYLSLLDNADKHLALTPILELAKASVRVLWPDGNSQAWSITVLGTNSELVSIEDISKGGHVEFHDDATATPDIYFGKAAQGFQRKAVIPTLRNLSNVVSQTLDTVMSALATAGVDLGENGGVIPRPKGKPRATS